jgi:hypothetical protein
MCRLTKREFINYAGIPSPKTLGLCAGVTNASYATTTEVYPDSPTATPEQCNDAQVACIEAALQCITREQKLAVREPATTGAA